MGNSMARAIAAAQRAAARVQGGAILYQRGNERIRIDDVTFGRTEYQAESADGVRIEYTDRDFIFPAERLILGGKLATPQKGDKITVVATGGLDGEVFEVLPIDGKRCYRTCDSSGYVIRVYAKRVAQ